MNRASTAPPAECMICQSLRAERDGIAEDLRDAEREIAKLQGQLRDVDEELAKLQQRTEA